MKKLLLITWTFSILLSSCKKTDSPDNSNPPLIELGPNTVIIDNSTAQTVQSIDSTHVVFDGNTDQLQRLVAGNIIVSGATTNAPTGFLRKITSIVKNGTVYNILTSESPLTEAFKNLHIDFTTSATSFTINPPDIVLYDVDGNNGTTNDQIKVKVNSGLTPKFHIKVDITNFKLDYAKIDGNFEGTLNTSITAGGSIGSISKEVNIYSQPIGVFTIPGTPIVIVASLRVSLGASGSINIEVVASDNKTSNINTFIEYKNNNWDKGFTRTMDNQFTFSGLVGNASAKVYIEPAIDFKLWGSNWAKGSITSQGYLKASGQLLPTPDCELKAGISAGAEANLKFFGWTFTAASYPDIFDFSKVLYSCSAPNTQLPTLSTTSVSSITNNTAASGGNITNSGASAVSARGICWATSPHPTISNNITTNGSGTGSFASSLSGLSPNTTYYVRAYATNTQGTNYGNEIVFNTNSSGNTLNQGLISHYPFSGNFLDSSSNSNHGTSFNTLFGNDRFGNPNKALYLNGINAFVEVPASSSLNSIDTCITISFWFKPETGNWENPVIFRESSYLVGYRAYSNTAGMYTIFGANSTAETSTSAIPNSNWFHVVIICTQSQHKRYINAIQEFVAGIGGTNSQNSNKLYIGQRIWTTNQYFKGYIDDIRIYNRVLTNSEIQILSQ